MSPLQCPGPAPARQAQTFSFHHCACQPTLPETKHPSSSWTSKKTLTGAPSASLPPPRVKVHLLSKAALWTDTMPLFLLERSQRPGHARIGRATEPRMPPPVQAARMRGPRRCRRMSTAEMTSALRRCATNVSSGRNMLCYAGL
ncbi:uncharacterized protein B0I36DRAFT_126230 [Microdochium trichocladiopsis]|uniref:Uncharacterized protein n=1 Tax=Microdochium trichocladiopsis TaxID=1682393 RepID=A0A9P9BLN8_9PEZI|nr:uncharacterized protein B0I36DRAFT_126230 [Microdochium trichocladiopsis]KAH7028793.1 hypothetical protein B0I36DRAFT_126230 [Microdochium trichocladiopsis]